MKVSVHPVCSNWMPSILRTTSAVIALVSVMSCLSHGEDAPKRPRVVGDWWQVAGDPDLGGLTRKDQQPVDFAVWQAADGTWQLWSCIRGTGEPGDWGTGENTLVPSLGRNELN